MKIPPPTIAIVGRPNVGKSSIFNRLAGGRIAIVHDHPGVTRDRLHADCTLTARPAQVVDTGGIGAELDDGFTEQVRVEADVAVGTASMILFTVDGREGLHPIDEALAADLRQSGMPVALVINKIDDASHEVLAAEFARLGFKTILPLSAVHGRGMGEMVDWLDSELAKLPQAEKKTDIKETRRPIKLAIVGRPNVGKSSLVNAVLGEDRAIVSEVAGTTRDAVDVPFSLGDEPFVFIDTAGLRPRSKRDSSVEVFSAMRTEQGIRRCDVAVLVVDCAGGIKAQDRTVAQMILKAEKPCCIILNKFDLYRPHLSRKERVEQVTEHVRRELFFLSHAPFAVVSALRKQHLSYLFRTVEKIRKAANEPVSTGQLNRLLRDGMKRNAPHLGNDKRRFKVLYATCTSDYENSPVPVPRFLLFVNRRDLLSAPYRRYLETVIRKRYPFHGLPLSFRLRARKDGEKS